MKITGTTLRQHRQTLGLSQAKLAEIADIPQHMLSAFELEKADLPMHVLKAVSNALANSKKVTAVVTRAKRYRDHKYADVQKLPERVVKATRTNENAVYTQVLKDIYSAHSCTQERQLSALSLFSGCGGFSLGFSAAGFLVKGFLELEDDLRKIYKLNFPNSVEIGSDITEITQESLASVAKTLGRIDVIIGGPPCQGFSLSGKRDVSDPRNELFKHYLRFVDVFRPKFAALENVRLLTSMKNREGGLVKDDICNEFTKHGYRIEYFEVNAKDYGVPQHRERVLFVAVRDDLDFTPSLPNFTHGDGGDMFSSLSPLRTFADACSDLPYIESGEKSNLPLHEAVKHPMHVIDWLWDVPQGFSAHDNKDPSKRPPSGYNTTYKRQVWNEPASTVQTTFGMISGCRNVHPIATRSLTIREAARLQSFPDEYLFSGSLGSVRTGIGNAVPPLLAYNIALHLKKSL
ncbi:MAG: DNA (cytosine-5-)-methyltransferase [Thiothrix sp.]|nr:MAG: DNA (cytosine-5-)-methyltransferase [Thiothrix sp.]